MFFGYLTKMRIQKRFALWLGNVGDEGGQRLPRAKKVLIVGRMQENAMLLTGRSQKPAGPPPKLKPTRMQKAKACAINIDRVSRFLFPALFACLNISYWIIFWKYI